jgi:hypothetical protein
MCLGWDDKDYEKNSAIGNIFKNVHLEDRDGYERITLMQSKERMTYD